MGLENMRGGYGRCPPLLVGGLLVVCLLLTCNWWSLSTQNFELIRQLDEVGEQLRRCADERDQSIQLRLSVEGRLKSTEEELAQLRVRLEQQDINADDNKKQLEEKDKDLKRVTKELDAAKNSVTMCTTELESQKKLDLSKDEMIASLKIEKDGVLAQREERKKEIERLNTQLSKAMSELNNLKASQPAAGSLGGNQIPPGKPSEAAGTKPKVAAKPAADLNQDERDEDNAKERGDDLNANEPLDAEDERFDKNNDDNDGNNIPEDNVDSVDLMAHAIQEDEGVAQAAPPPAKPAASV